MGKTALRTLRNEERENPEKIAEFMAGIDWWEAAHAR